ncbi:MAG: cytochrome P450 [Alphaproteobacteria bacterium]
MSAKRPPVKILGNAKPSKSRTGVREYIRTGTPEDYRTYEVYQRERVHENTEKIRPVQLISPAFVQDPYPVLETLRENYPCYRDWLGNAYWITRYDDVTSIFTDEGNFETRSKLWFYRMEEYGRDLRNELPVLTAFERAYDTHVAPLTEAIVRDLKSKGSADLALDFAARLPMELLARALDLPVEHFPRFVELFWRMQRGYDWEPRDEEAGKQAMADLAKMIAPLLKARRTAPGVDMISAIAGLDLEGGPATAEDVVVTLLEMDHETLHGALANMWFLLLTHPDEMSKVNDDRRLLKFAYLETLRHSTPVLWKKRFARHEVERFGRLLPIGGLIYCAAAGANRDPRQFKNPDQFIVGRKDLCQREPRGHYRADGLPAGVALGLGTPSKHPALPEDRPRSLYAITRDTAVTASNILLDALPDLQLKPGAEPTLRSLRLGEMHTCWQLPVVF